MSSQNKTVASVKARYRNRLCSVPSRSYNGNRPALDAAHSKGADYND